MLSLNEKRDVGNISLVGVNLISICRLVINALSYIIFK